MSRFPLFCSRALSIAAICSSMMAFSVAVRILPSRLYVSSSFCKRFFSASRRIRVFSFSLVSRLSICNSASCFSFCDACSSSLICSCLAFSSSLRFFSSAACKSFDSFSYISASFCCFCFSRFTMVSVKAVRAFSVRFLSSSSLRCKSSFCRS